MIYISFDIGVKNLALCIIKEYEENVSLIDWRIISLAESKKDAGNIKETTETLYAELDNIIGSLNELEITTIHTVLIENQPSNINGIMKTIQWLIFSYFNLLKHWDNLVENVILVNASLKLQTHTIIPPSRQDTKVKYTRKEKYINNKKDSIEVCKYYIKNDEKLLNFLNSNKKLDDFSDAFLQTISYIRKNGNKIENVSLDDKNMLR